MKPNKKLLVGAAVAGMVGMLGNGSAFALTKVTSSTKGECHGVTSCKGQGDCGGKGHACAGKNECAGQGWKTMSLKDCIDAKFYSDEKIFKTSEVQLDLSTAAKKTSK